MNSNGASEVGWTESDALQIESSPESVAGAVVEALRIYRHEDATRARVESAVRGRASRSLDALFDKFFGAEAR